jgi:hypothetical protein
VPAYSSLWQIENDQHVNIGISVGGMPSHGAEDDYSM